MAQAKVASACAGFDERSSLRNGFGSTFGKEDNLAKQISLYAEEEELLQNELIDDYTKKYLSSETRK